MNYSDSESSIESSHRQSDAMSGPVTTLDRWIARLLLRWVALEGFQIILWNQEVIRQDPISTVSASVAVHDRGALVSLVLNPGLNFGEMFCSGRIDVEGDLALFVERVYNSLGKRNNLPVRKIRSAYRHYQPSLNSMSGSRKNIHHHYDISNHFYSMWLDAEMVYTCAYFHKVDASLEDAQAAKMELVCRKLGLRKGMKVIEAGCGWGGLARYMARNYHVNVRAFNISREQIHYARERACMEGLEGMIEYVHDDYRNIQGTCDAFVSVGMLEHVGPDNYGNLGRIIKHSLNPHGMAILHTIGQNYARPLSEWFLKRIFPGSYPPTLREMMEILEPWNLAVLDVENLRLHYAATLTHWLERFDRNMEKIEEMFDRSFVRAWRLYLSGGIANFRIGDLQLFQVLITHPQNNSIPQNRLHMNISSVYDRV